MDVSNDSLIPLLLDFFKAIPDCGIRDLADIKRVSILVDNTYSSLKKAEVMSMLKSNLLLIGEAEAIDNSELFDCDDYALQLKASLTALYRTKRLQTETVSPPAVGIVITQNHAVNIVLCESSTSELEILLVDPSIKTPKMVSDASASAQLLRTLPISLIYM